MARLYQANNGSPHLDTFPVSTRGARAANTVPEQGYERQEIPTFVELQDAPRPSDEQGIGKTFGFQWPWQRVFQSLVPKREKQGAHWPNQRLTAPRQEIHGWGTAYLLYFEQTNRHVWPGGGVGAPQQVIEHPQPMPLTSLARRL
jgi:hypothetical protein